MQELILERVQRIQCFECLIWLLSGNLNVLGSHTGRLGSSSFSGLSIALFLFTKSAGRIVLRLRLVFVDLIVKWKATCVKHVFIVLTIKCLMARLKANYVIFSFWYCIKCKRLTCPASSPATFRRMFVINYKLLLWLLSHFHVVSSYYWLRRYFNISCIFVHSFKGEVESIAVI